MHEALFLAIAHPIRRSVLDELRIRETPSTQLAVRFGVSPSVLSQHLKVLKETGLVTETRVGRQRIYSLRPEPLQEVSDWIESFSEFWPKKMAALGKHLRKNKK